MATTSGLFPDEQGSLGFPVPLAERYRPRTLAGFIGLEKQKKVQSTLLIVASLHSGNLLIVAYLF